MLSIGKLRGLQTMSSPNGLFQVLALDHRGSLARALGAVSGDPTYYTTLSEFKIELVQHLAGRASAVLIDPEYGAAEVIARGVLPGGKGLLVAVEESGHRGPGTARLNAMIPGWSVEKVKRMGASAAKLRVDYNPWAGGVAEQQEQLVAQVVQAARAADLALIVEPVVYSTGPQASPDPAHRPALVTETARRIGALGPDVLKVEFPLDPNAPPDDAAWLDACLELDAAATVPWVLLSAGVDYDIFSRQLLAASRAGASGFVVGRAVWQEAAALKGEQRQTFLQTTAARRLEQLAAITQAYARPWITYYPHQAQAAPEGWFATYSS